jgi:hypothetical protein
MPAQLVDAPLGLQCVFSGGRSALVKATRHAAHNPALVRELLTGLARLVHPHGQIDSWKTAMAYTVSAGWLAKTLAERGFHGGAGQLTRGTLAQVWLAANYRQEADTRAMLAACDEATGVLDAGVRDLVRGRSITIFPGTAPLEPYGEGEWARLERACRAAVDASFARHRAALTLAATGRDPGHDGWRDEANVAWVLTRIGPADCGVLGARVGQNQYWIQRRARSVRQLNIALFCDSDDVVAYRLLLGIYSGIVPDGIDGLGVSDLEWTGDGTALLDYVKARTSRESVVLPGRALRLLEQWLEHSALARRFAPAHLRGALWLRWRLHGAPHWITGAADPLTQQRWIVKHAVSGQDGAPFAVHRHRIRTTYESLRERSAWFGSTRATIDPNHSPKVEGDRYLTASTPAQREAVGEIVAQAQADLLRKAQAPRVLDAEDAAGFAARFPDLVASRNLDDAAIRELVGGARDVFTAACADPLAGLHGPAGKPCPARPWVCLLCPLAVFAPRHAGNLLRLRAFFTRQWQQMTSAHFAAVFGPYAARVDEVLDALRARHPQALRSAAADVRDHDGEIPLLPEERTA